MIVHWSRSWMVGGSGFDFSFKMFSRQVSPGKPDGHNTEMMIGMMMIMIWSKTLQSTNVIYNDR